MIEEKPKTNPINSQTRMRPSIPYSPFCGDNKQNAIRDGIDPGPCPSLTRFTVLIIMKLIVPRIPQMWCAKLTPPPCTVEASIMNHHPIKNWKGLTKTYCPDASQKQYLMIHTRMDETKAATAFRVLVAGNKMQDDKTSTKVMAVDLPWLSGSTN